MNKWLFLDIDGVLNSERFYSLTRGGKGTLEEIDRVTVNEGYEPYREELDRTGIEIVNSIVLATGCKVILSSSWRIDEKCIERLGSCGLKSDGRTGYSFMKENMIRGEEIEQFLEENASEGDTFCILDDDKDMLPYHMSEGHFVHVSAYGGVDKVHRDTAIGVLNFGKVWKRGNHNMV